MACASIAALTIRIGFNIGSEQLEQGSLLQGLWYEHGFKRISGSVIVRFCGEENLHIFVLVIPSPQFKFLRGLPERPVQNPKP